MAIDLTTIDTKVTEAATAIEAGDSATAVRKLKAAQALLAGVPRSRGADGSEIEYRDERIKGLIDSLEQDATAAAGVKVTKIEYTQASS